MLILLQLCYNSVWAYGYPAAGNRTGTCQIGVIVLPWVACKQF
ncbi:hypothetical protein [Candidatus Methylacidithermus pantelleriae]|nr:hypothetical protein [Candidatus Methylacidithermus pantelleriae]